MAASRTLSAAPSVLPLLERLSSSAWLWLAGSGALKPAPVLFSSPKGQRRQSEAAEDSTSHFEKRRRQRQRALVRSTKRHLRALILPRFHSNGGTAFLATNSPSRTSLSRMSSRFPSAQEKCGVEVETTAIQFLPCTVNAVASVVGLEIETVFPDVDSRHSPSMNAL